MAGTYPPPTQTVQVVAPGVYGPGTRTWPQRSIPDSIRAIELAIDVTNRNPATQSVSVLAEISFDGGQTWASNFGASLQIGDDNAATNEMSAAMGKGSSIPMTPGRLIRGQATIVGASMQTSMVIRVWT